MPTVPQQMRDRAKAAAQKRRARSASSRGRSEEAALPQAEAPKHRPVGPPDAADHSTMGGGADRIGWQLHKSRKPGPAVLGQSRQSSAASYGEAATSRAGHAVNRAATSEGEAKVGILQRLHERRIDRVTGGHAGKTTTVSELLPEPAGLLGWAPDDVLVREVLDIDDGVVLADDGARDFDGDTPAIAALEEGGRPTTEGDDGVRTDAAMTEGHDDEVVVAAAGGGPGALDDGGGEGAMTEVSAIRLDPAMMTGVTERDDLVDAEFPLLVLRLRSFGATPVAIHALLSAIVGKTHGDAVFAWRKEARARAIRSGGDRNTAAPQCTFPAPLLHATTPEAHTMDAVCDFSFTLRHARTATLRQLLSLVGTIVMLKSGSKCSVLAIDSCAEPVETTYGQGTVGATVTATASPPRIDAAEQNQPQLIQDTLSHHHHQHDDATGVAIGEAATGGVVATTASDMTVTRGEEEASAAPPVPQHIATEYEVLLRLAPDSSVGVAHRQAERCRDQGFINYTSSMRYRLPASTSAAVGRALLEDRFHGVVAGYASMLAGDDHITRLELTSFRARMATHFSIPDEALCRRNVLRDIRDTHRFVSDRLSTLKRHLPHLSSDVTLPGYDVTAIHELERFLKHASEADGDVGRIVEEIVPERAMRDFVRTLSDVHFNTIASHRIRKMGLKVVPGDTVCLDPAMPWDSYAPSTFGTPLSTTMDLPAEESEPVELHRASADALHVVESAADAARFSVTDVVLPKLGYLPSIVSDPTSASTVAATADGGIGRDALQQAFLDTYNGTLSESAALTCAIAVNSLRLPGLLSHPLAPHPTFRRLVAKPTQLHLCGWDDRLAVRFGDKINGELAAATIMDGEGNRRQLPTDVPRANLAGIARPAIRGREARERFVAATKDTVAIALRARLPAGVALTSLLREVACVTMLSGGDVFQLAGDTGRRIAQSQDRKKAYQKKRGDQFRQNRERREGDH